MRLVALDTTCIGEHQGLLCDQRLAWADAALRASSRPTLIVMHHPPFRTGIRWVDAIGVHGGRKLQELVARHPAVERILLRAHSPTDPSSLGQDHREHGAEHLPRSGRVGSD